MSLFIATVALLLTKSVWGTSVTVSSSSSIKHQDFISINSLLETVRQEVCNKSHVKINSSHHKWSYLERVTLLEEEEKYKRHKISPQNQPQQYRLHQQQSLLDQDEIQRSYPHLSLQNQFASDKINHKNANCRPYCCLVVTVDNRNFSNSLSSSKYFSKTAVLNYKYARFHGYDYVLVEVDPLNLLRQKHVKKKMSSTYANMKEIPSVFNHRLSQFRASPWAKVPVLYNLTVSLGEKYDFILYLDSDAAISPLHWNRSIKDLIQAYSIPVGKGRNDEKWNSNITESVFYFFTDTFSTMPNSGAFLFRPNHPLTQDFFKMWWEVDIPMSNTGRYFEQDALWYLLDRAFNDSTTLQGRTLTSLYTILTEYNYPSDEVSFKDHWIYHITSWKDHNVNREPIFNTLLAHAGLYYEDVFTALLRTVITRWRVDGLLLSNIIDKHSEKNVSRFIIPPYLADGTVFWAWWGGHRETDPLTRHVSFHALKNSANESNIFNFNPNANGRENFKNSSHYHDSKKKLSALKAYEGFLITEAHNNKNSKGIPPLHSDYWFISSQGKKRGFTSWQHFHDLGFNIAMALKLPISLIGSIPTGRHLPRFCFENDGQSKTLQS